MTDIDFLSYYINFLRTISLKLTIQSLNLFFNQGLNSFPLLDNSLLLFNHPDVMIQNVSRTIFLSILKFSYPPLIDYICFLPQINIFIKIVFKLNNMIESLIQIKNNQFVNEDISENINEFIDEINGEILFIQDILSVGNIKINYILINSIFYIVFFNNLFKNLINN
jgi:protein CLEC16A